jgi:hypothetical protein
MRAHKLLHRGSQKKIGLEAVTQRFTEVHGGSRRFTERKLVWKLLRRGSQTPYSSRDQRFTERKLVWRLLHRGPQTPYSSRDQSFTEENWFGGCYTEGHRGSQRKIGLEAITLRVILQNLASNFKNTLFKIVSKSKLLDVFFSKLYLK